MKEIYYSLLIIFFGVLLGTSLIWGFIGLYFNNMFLVIGIPIQAIIGSFFLIKFVQEEYKLYGDE